MNHLYITEGVNSIARKYISNNTQDVKLTKWKCAYRQMMLPFGDSGPPDLDPTLHYSFTGNKRSIEFLVLPIITIMIIVCIVFIQMSYLTIVPTGINIAIVGRGADKKWQVTVCIRDDDRPKVITISYTYTQTYMHIVNALPCNLTV